MVLQVSFVIAFHVTPAPRSAAGSAMVLKRLDPLFLQPRHRPHVVIHRGSKYGIEAFLEVKCLGMAGIDGPH